MAEQEEEEQLKFLDERDIVVIGMMLSQAIKKFERQRTKASHKLEKVLEDYRTEMNDASTKILDVFDEVLSRLRIKEAGTNIEKLERLKGD